jgi:cell filamentation protein
MYAAVADPYCYPGTAVLKNKLNLRNQARLDAFEAEITSQRASEPMPIGRLSVTHYRSIHRHLFQDVFTWAGRFRTVRISKGGNMFCYPEHIKNQMAKLFAGLQRDKHFRGLSAPGFAAESAHLLAELNAIHPFREGNGRTQLAFLTLLAEVAGHPLALNRLKPDDMMRAMVVSFNRNDTALRKLIEALASPRKR